MWIKILYCTEDLTYAKSLAAYIDKAHGEKVEMNVLPSISELQDYLLQNTVDVVLYGSEFEDNFPVNQKRIGYTWAVMAENIYENTAGNIAWIDKYQSAEYIYKTILDLYAGGERVRQFHSNKTIDKKQRIFAFLSASGGVGTTTVARAFAKKSAGYEKVLYLNLGTYYFDEQEIEKSGIDDILMALKSRRNILPVKLESSAFLLKDRVTTYGASKSIIDLLELDAQDIVNLLDGIRNLKEYGKIILDIGSGMSMKEAEILKSADCLIYVADESEIGKLKYERFSIMLNALEQKENMRLLHKTYIFRNKVKKDFENEFSEFHSKVIGWAPYVSSDSYETVLERIAQSDSFSNLEMENVGECTRQGGIG